MHRSIGIIWRPTILMKNPNPTEAELTEALSGNYCRCISHYQVIRTVMAFVRQINKEAAEHV